MGASCVWYRETCLDRRGAGYAADSRIWPNGAAAGKWRPHYLSEGPGF